MNIREKKIYRITLIGTAVNALLIALKFIAGIFGRSSAMVADAVHSLSEFVTDAIILIFVKIAGKPRDKGHDYGHGKFETLATLIIGIILAAAGLGLLINGASLVIKSIKGEPLEQPTMLALIIALISIVSKEWLYRYTLKTGKTVNSQAVIANAWHHRSDAISSAGTLAGVAGAIFLGPHWRILDPLAAMAVSIFIIKSGYDIIKPAANELLESSLPEEQEKEIRTFVESVPGIDNVHNLRTRRIGNCIAVDMHVNMDGTLSLNEAHSKATVAEKAIKHRFGENAIVTIHMEPTKK